jgi:hypothetical protein
MATIQRYVDTASAGGDGTTQNTAGADAAYASLNSWEANQTATATDDYIVDCYATGGTADTTGTTINFASAALTGTIIVQGGTGAGGRNTGNTFIDPSKYRIVVGNTCIAPTSARITLRHLQMDCTAAGAPFTSAINLTSANMTALNIEYNRIRSAARACMGFNGSNGGSQGTFNVRNNIMVQTGGNSCMDLDSSGTNNSALTWNIQHNTMYPGSSRPGVRIADLSGSQVQTVNVNNNIVVGTTNPFEIQANTSLTAITVSYNGTDNGLDGTTNEITLSDLTTVFTSPGTTSFTADFSLLMAIPGLTLSVSDDITGAVRGTPGDIGAYEYPDAAGPAKYTLTAETGTYTVTGIAASLQATRKLNAGVGAYSLTGYDATLVYTPRSGAFVLTANAGSYAVTGVSASLLKGWQIIASRGTYTLTGQAAGLAVGRSLPAATGSYSVSGFDAVIQRTAILHGEVGAYSIAGMDATLTYAVPVDPSRIWTAVGAVTTNWTAEGQGNGIWTPATPAGGAWTVQ